MTIHQLTDSQDPRVADYTRLTDTGLRRRREPAEGMYIAETPKVLRRALMAGHTPRSFFLTEKWLPELDDVLRAFPHTPAYVGESGVLEAITGFHLHRGAMAAMERPTPVNLDTLLGAAQRVAVVEDIVDHTKVGCSEKQDSDQVPQRGRSRIAIFEDLVDHTNLGAAFRSAAALGVDAVLVTPRCADPLYRRSIRVSMGAVFQVPWTRIESWPDGIDQLKDAGYVVAGMTLGEGASTLDELVAEDHENLAMVFGTEGHGLTPAANRRLDRRVRIPMMGGVDSLNIAASAAVAFYATR